MRFKRSDLPGILIAVFAPVGVMLIFLASFEAWGHHGTPLLGAMATNLAIGAGLIAAFTRFIRNWDMIGAFFGLLVLAIGGVIVMQQTGNDGTAFATALKWVGVIAFLLLNVAIIQQILVHGVNPMLVRRDERLANEREMPAE